MMSLTRLSLFCLALVFIPAGLSGCRSKALVPGQAAAPSRVKRSEVMQTAARYATHRWIGTRTNVKHGVDRAGIRVDTPDISYQETGAIPGYWIPGEMNVGMPYQCGGFCSPEEFDRGIANGLAAGDVYTSRKRALLYDGVSAEAVGVDCSGFVSRCWNLPRAFSTRELAQLCEDLLDWNDLKPGDALNLFNAHVLLFSSWVGPDRTCMVAYETGGPPDWKVMRHVIGTDFLKNKGYRALRYRGIGEG